MNSRNLTEPDLARTRVLPLDEAFEDGRRKGFDEGVKFRLGWSLVLLVVGYALGWYFGGRR